MESQDKRLEHRCDSRHALELPVTLYSRKSPPVPAQVCNLSRGGALIAAKRYLFPRYTMLYLDFGSQRKCRRESTIIPALVIHRGQQGVGVMFLWELPDELYLEFCPESVEHE